MRDLCRMLLPEMSKSLSILGDVVPVSLKHLNQDLLIFYVGLTPSVSVAAGGRPD